jgi:hypothetical protein
VTNRESIPALIHEIELIKLKFRGRLETLQEHRFTKKDWMLFRSEIAHWQQGYSMKRPSEIRVSLAVKENKILGVRVGGSAMNLTLTEAEI